MNKLEKYLLQLTIFLIPTNLALHWYTSDAFIHGRLIDYLLPKFYLSDLSILGIFIILLFKYGFIGLFKRLYYLFYSSRNISLFILFCYLIIRAVFTAYPLSSLWYVAKLTEMTLFGVYLVISLRRRFSPQILIAPLLASILFQSLLGLYQYINQSSAFGYYFLGEPDLNSIGISKVNYFGVLKVPPYGTTPHPNVLAGYLSISSLLLLLCIQKSSVSMKKTFLLISVIGLSLMMILITGSQVGFLSLCIGLLLISLRNMIRTYIYRLLFLIYSISIPFISLLFINFTHQYNQLADNRSFFVRYELIQAGIFSFKSYSLFGVGPNLFSTLLPNTTLTGQKTLFLQPVHHFLVLLLVEIGVIGSLLSLAALMPLFRRLKLSSPVTLIPLVMMITIGSFDHYPLTLQTGQLLLLLSVVFPLV